MKSCLFIVNRTLVEVPIPFHVIVLHDIGKLCKGQTLLVRDVKYDRKGLIIYNIKNELYFAHHFQLVL